MSSATGVNVSGFSEPGLKSQHIAIPSGSVPGLMAPIWQNYRDSKWVDY